MYDDASYQREYERRRAIRRKRARQRRRKARLRAAGFFISVLLIGAMFLVIGQQKQSPPSQPEDPAQTLPQDDSGDQGDASPRYPELYSPLDADGDGIDDYHDIMQGARAYIATGPVYESRYYAGGYPDDGYGVCTDVIWAAFRAAGYELKDLVDADVAAHPARYPHMEEADPNIDFRRVNTLDCFFSAYAQTLTCEFDDPSQFQPGDILIFGDRDHIAICSDKRNLAGMPYIIHHGSLEDGPIEANHIYRHEVTGHYRWNGGA